MNTYGSTPIFGRRSYGLKTANANTAYYLLVEPMSVSAYTYIEFAQFTTTGAAHVATVMRPLSNTLTGSLYGPGQPCSCYLDAPAAGAQATININQDPGVYTAYTFNNNAAPRTANDILAANDYVAYQYPDGTWEVNTVSSVALPAVVLTNNLATGGLAAGAPVFYFGVAADVNPYDARAHPGFNLYAPASPTTINLGSEGYPWIGTFNRGQPLLVYVNNVTDASTLERCTAAYSDRGSPYAWNG